MDFRDFVNHQKVTTNFTVFNNMKKKEQVKIKPFLLFNGVPNYKKNFFVSRNRVFEKLTTKSCQDKPVEK